MYYSFAPFFFRGNSFYSIPADKQASVINDCFIDMLDRTVNQINNELVREYGYKKITFDAAVLMGVWPCDNIQDWATSIMEAADQHAAIEHDQRNYRPGY